MKKILFLLLCFTALLAVGCNSPTDTPSTGSSGDSTSSTPESGDTPPSGANQPSTSTGFVTVAGSTVNGPVGDSLVSSVFIENRTVIIPTLYVCDHEVTQSEYQAIMGNNPSHFNGTTGKEPAENETQVNRPVEKVSWYDALVYCNKRSIAENFTPCYKIKKADDNTIDSTNPADWGAVPNTNDDRWNDAICDWTANGYRLPTEAEWEYIARGGSSFSTENYSGTDNEDELGNYVWYSTNSGSKTHEVKKKMANSLCVYDMTGNVYEWCWDWSGTIIATGNNATPATGPISGTQRIARGGSVSLDPGLWLSLRGRNSFYSVYKYEEIGFRVVRKAQ